MLGEAPGQPLGVLDPTIEPTEHVGVVLGEQR
jgi:hypothetical protein